MSFSIIILTGLFYLVPGTIEVLHRSTQSTGNLALNGVYFNVLNNRNFVYIFGIFSIITLYLPYKILRLFSEGLFVFFIFSYFNAIDKWIKHLT